VLAGADHKVILNEGYNTSSGKKDDSARLAKDLESIPAGSVIIAAVRDDAATNLKGSARKAFAAMGSKAVKNLGAKNSWAFIGIKSMKKSVEQTGVTSEFGTVLSYTKVVKQAKKVQRVEGGSKIQALSSVSPSQVRVVINDVDVLKAEQVKPGFNIVVLAGANHEVMFVKNYNTAASQDASHKLAEDEAAVPIGSVVIAVVKDDAGVLTQSVKDVFAKYGSKEINQLSKGDGFMFMGIKGSRQHLERRGAQVSGGLVLGYSRVTKREKKTQTITQTKSYKRTITRVFKKTITETKNGVTRTKVVTRVQKRVVTCKRSRTIKKSSTKTTV
jgi:hypothetical protein